MASKTAGLGNPLPPHSTAHPEDLNMLRKWFSDYITKPNDSINTSLIYLSRSKWKRGISGELELEKQLEELGFTIFHGDINLFEQIKLFSNARVIVGLTGAAMSNMVWMPKGATVLQLHVPNVIYRFYYNIGCMCKLNYQFFETPRDSWSISDVENIILKVKGLIG